MKFTYSILLFFFITACGSSKKNSDSNVAQSTNPQIIRDTVYIEKENTVITENGVYQATNTVLTDLIHTKLEVDFNWPKARMNGRAYITAKPHWYASDSLILDAKGMDILAVKIGATDLMYTYDSLKLKIKLDKVYTRTMQYTVDIKYTSKPNERETGGSAAITSDKGLYFINNTGETDQMPQIWTQGETESNSVWFPTIDSPNSKTTQEIYITVDNKYKTLSNGKLLTSKVNSNGTRTDYWKQELPHAPYLFMMAIGEFKMIKDSYTRSNGQKMDVNYYVEPQWESNAKAIFGETPMMIDFFSKLLKVDYAWDKYSQIVVRDYVSGAMENTGAVIFGDYAYKTDRELLDNNDNSTIAHELFHHWFGDLVTAESWSNLTLNESFANYSQYLWDEHRYGKDEAMYNALDEMDGYFQSAENGGFHDLVWFSYESREQMFDGHSYNKGGRILHMLRNYLGDETFFEGIHKYLETNKFKAAEFHQLRLAFEEVSGQDLNWFFNQWYLASGHPELEVSYDFSNGTKIMVEQKQDLNEFPLFKLPVDIAIYDGAGKRTERIWITEASQEFTIATTGEVKNIVFDEQEMLLAKIQESKTADMYLHQYYNHKGYKLRAEGLIKGSKAKANGIGESLVLAALNDSFWDIRIIAIEKSANISDAAKLTANPKIKSLAISDPKSSVRSAALKYLAEELEKDEMIAFLDNIFVKEQSYNVLTEALKALAVVDNDLAMAKAGSMENEKSSKMLLGIGQLYAKNGTPEKIDFFKNAFRSGSLKGFDEIGMLNNYTVFLINNPEQFEKAVVDYQYLSENGGTYTKLFLSQFITGISNKLGNDIAKNEADILKMDVIKDTTEIQQLQSENAYLRKVIADFQAIK